MEAVATVGSDQESAAVVQPGESALDDRAVAAQPGAVFSLTAGNQRLDAALPDQPTVLQNRGNGPLFSRISNCGAHRNPDLQS